MDFYNLCTRKFLRLLNTNVLQKHRLTKFFKFWSLCYARRFESDSFDHKLLIYDSLKFLVAILNKAFWILKTHFAT